MSENRTYDSIRPSHTTLTAWPLWWGIKVRDIRPNLALMLQPPHTPAGPAEAWLMTQKSVSAIGPRPCWVCLRNTWALYLHHVNLFYAWPLRVSPLSFHLWQYWEIIILFLIGFMILGGGILLALISFIFEVCLKGKSSKKERVKENLEG